MALLQQWRDTAYSQQTDKKVLQKFWTDYFMIEKGIYEKLLSEPDVKVKGTVNLFYKRKGYLRRTVKEPGRAGKRHG
mgnify:CR=1 FL=1